MLHPGIKFTFFFNQKRSGKSLREAESGEESLKSMAGFASSFNKYLFYQRGHVLHQTHFFLQYLTQGKMNGNGVNQ